MKKEKEEMLSYCNKKILNPVGWLFILSILGLLSSPFVWIYSSGTNALKVFSTSFLSMLIFLGIWHLLKWIIKDTVDKFE